MVSPAVRMAVVSASFSVSVQALRGAAGHLDDAAAYLVEAGEQTVCMAPSAYGSARLAGAAAGWRTAWGDTRGLLREACEGAAQGLRANAADYVATDRAVSDGFGGRR